MKKPEWPPPGCPPIEEKLDQLTTALRSTGLRLSVRDQQLTAHLDGWRFTLSEEADHQFLVVDCVAPETPAESVVLTILTANLPEILAAAEAAGVRDVDRIFRSFDGLKTPWEIRRRPFDRTDPCFARFAGELASRGILFSLSPTTNPAGART